MQSPAVDSTEQGTWHCWLWTSVAGQVRGQGLQLTSGEGGVLLYPGAPSLRRPLLGLLPLRIGASVASSLPTPGPCALRPCSGADREHSSVPVPP
jgi:hypothetical protein